MISVKMICSACVIVAAKRKMTGPIVRCSRFIIGVGGVARDQPDVKDVSLTLKPKQDRPSRATLYLEWSPASHTFV